MSTSDAFSLQGQWDYKISIKSNGSNLDIFLRTFLKDKFKKLVLVNEAHCLLTRSKTSSLCPQEGSEHMIQFVMQLFHIIKLLHIVTLYIYLFFTNNY